MNKSILVFIVALIAAMGGYFVEKNHKASSDQTATQVDLRKNDSSSSNTLQNQQDASSAIYSAYLHHENKIQVQGVGRVKAILKDDREGTRHQKFILDVGNGLTVLVAHNIDLARRLDGLQKGDTVEFYGEYKYNPKGGILHWTHHDPSNQHESGWLKWDGQVYQ